MMNFKAITERALLCCGIAWIISGLATTLWSSVTYIIECGSLMASWQNPMINNTELSCISLTGLAIALMGCIEIMLTDKYRKGGN